MWQRIQTVFLIIAIISLLAAIFLPIWVMRDGGTQFELYAIHHTSISDGGGRTTLYYPFCITAILIVASMTVAAIQITKYKDRMLQIKLGTLNALLLVGALGSAVYFATSMVKTHQGGLYGFGLWLPALAVICNWLAMRFIRRDEKLVRDSDRLR